MFFTFDQNNTGGGYVENDSVCRYVIIQADNFEDANSIAETVGIYFDGCESGIDCDCCGDRWDRQSSNNDGTVLPELAYGEPIRDNQQSVMLFAYPGQVYCRVYYSGMTIVKEYRIPFEDNANKISSDGLM